MFKTFLRSEFIYLFMNGFNHNTVFAFEKLGLFEYKSLVRNNRRVL